MTGPKPSISTKNAEPGTGGDTLPPTIPIFPLANVMMLPYTKLALNIFEPRYLAMVEFALSHKRAIGMIQTRSVLNEHATVVKAGVSNDPTDNILGNILDSVLNDNMHEKPEVYKTGCLGRIVSFEETGDGRFAITLMGICKFTIVEELPQTHSFRLIRADYEMPAENVNDAIISPSQRTSLMHTVKTYLAAKGIEANWSSIEQAADLDLVTSLAMLCPFNAGEKQALLECSGIHERSSLLTNLMTLSLHTEKSNKKPIIH